MRFSTNEKTTLVDGVVDVTILEVLRKVFPPSSPSSFHLTAVSRPSPRYLPALIRAGRERAAEQSRGAAYRLASGAINRRGPEQVSSICPPIDNAGIDGGDNSDCAHMLLLFFCVCLRVRVCLCVSVLMQRRMSLSVPNYGRFNLHLVLSAASFDFAAVAKWIKSCDGARSATCWKHEGTSLSEAFAQPFAPPRSAVIALG